MSVGSLEELFLDELKDLYSAEKQLTKAIPKMAKGSNDATLKTAFKDHLKGDGGTDQTSGRSGKAP